KPTKRITTTAPPSPRSNGGKRTWITNTGEQKQLVPRKSRRMSGICVFVLVFITSSLGWHPPCGHAAESSLSELAKRRFSRTFTDCEQKLLEYVPKGENSPCGPDRTQTDSVSKDVGQERRQNEIHADVLRWICTNPEASKLVTSRGIQLSGGH